MEARERERERERESYTISLKNRSTTQRSTDLGYLSPRKQNELIDIMGQRVRKQIIGDIKKAKYFSIIFDSTPDISRQDHLSHTIRY